jgi:hypothetical protein
MPVPNNIKDISSIPASNSPLGSDTIGTSLDEYLRSIQAIVRQESVNKSWERRNDTPTYINATTFTLVGNLTSFYNVGRAIKAIDSSVITGLITSSNFASGVTTVITTWNSGNLTASLSEVQLGIETSATKPALISTAMQPVVNAADLPTARNLMGVTNQWVGNINFSANGVIPVTLPFPQAYTAGMSFTFRCSAVNSTGFTFQPTGQSVGAVNLPNPLVVGRCYTAFADGIIGWTIFDANLIQGLLPSNNLSDITNRQTALQNLQITTANYNSSTVRMSDDATRVLKRIRGVTGAIANGATGTITLPNGYGYENAASWVVVASPLTVSGGSPSPVNVISANQFTINNQGNATSAFYWLAEGHHT